MIGVTLAVDSKKYARLANRIVVKAIETEEEYDHMVAAVEHLMDRAEENLSTEESALLETMAILVQAHDDRPPLPPVAPNEMLAYRWRRADGQPETCCQAASLFNVTVDRFIQPAGGPGKRRPTVPP